MRSFRPEIWQLWPILYSFDVNIPYGNIFREKSLHIHSKCLRQDRMDFRPKNALNLTKLGQFDQFFFTISPSMYPWEGKIFIEINFGEKKTVRQKKARIQ